MAANANPDLLSTITSPAVAPPVDLPVVQVSEETSSVAVNWDGDGITEQNSAQYSPYFVARNTKGKEPTFKVFGSLLHCDGGTLTIGETRYRIQVTRQQQQRNQQQRTELLNQLVYRHGARNGVNPELFRGRVPATNILQLLPLTVEAFQSDESITRLLLYGPPASGKTSIMGKICVTLQERYLSTPIYFVRAAELNSEERRNEVYNFISRVTTCVVLLDDAQEWYDYPLFFGLFKATSRLLVAAATYSVEQFNPRTPVEFQHSERSNLVADEIAPLLQSFEVDPSLHEEMKRWFGDVYGRYHIIARNLLKRWRQLKQENDTLTLAETYYHSATMEDPDGIRFLPVLSDHMRSQLLRVWKGCGTYEERQKLIPYGVFDECGNWSCDYVSRKYFLDLFHDENPTPGELFANGVPLEVDLANAGLGALNWAQLQMSLSSSKDREFPIEDIWQAEFYGAIGKFVPRELTFCKEYAVTNGTKGGHVDFVLRNGCTRAIEFLVHSRDVKGHHKRFEDGAYNSLCLSGATYLVVDIIPWHGMTDLCNLSRSVPLQLAEEKFEGLTEGQRRHHAVFIASIDLTAGILYAYDAGASKAVEYGRSPTPRP